jgi:hypothetical protein
MLNRPNIANRYVWFKYSSAVKKLGLNPYIHLTQERKKQQDKEYIKSCSSWKPLISSKITAVWCAVSRCRVTSHLFEITVDGNVYRDLQHQFVGLLNNDERYGGLSKTKELLSYPKKQWWRRTKQQTDRWKLRKPPFSLFIVLLVASPQYSCSSIQKTPRKCGHNTCGRDKRRDASSVAKYPSDVFRFRLCVYWSAWQTRQDKRQAARPPGFIPPVSRRRTIHLTSSYAAL